MRKKVFKFTRVIAFLVILLLTLAAVNLILLPKSYAGNSTWPASTTFNQFYEMEEDSIDVIFIGSSVVANAFSPQQIYDDYGIRSYNLASAQQSIFLSYYWLKEALQYQSPQVVVLDSKFIFDLHPESPINTTEGVGRETIDNMKWGANKRELIDELCSVDSSQDKLSYYLTNIRYHGRWTELDESDFNLSLSDHDALKGQAVITSLGDEEYTTFTPSDTTIMASPQALMEDCLNRIVELCNENDIQLMLISLPDTMTDATNNYLSYYAAAHEINYYNFCLTDYYNAIGATLPKENVVEHENIWGAAKMSKYVGSILRDTYHVPGVEDSQWADTSAYYQHILNNANLKYIDNFEEYLTTLQGDYNYVTFIAIKDDGFRYITDSEIALLNSLGLYAPFSDMFRYSYCAVIDPQNGNSEELSDAKQVTLTGSMNEGSGLYSLVSGGGNAGVNVGISIDGSSYAVNYVGINITVYDRLTGAAVDSVCFYTNENGAYCKR